MKTIEPRQRELLLGQLEQVRRKIAFFDARSLAVQERLGPDCEGAEITEADEARALRIEELSEMVGLIQGWNDRRGFGWILPLVGRPHDVELVFARVTAVIGRAPGEPPVCRWAARLTSNWFAALMEGHRRLLFGQGLLMPKYF